MALVAVPNVSEGRNQELIAGLVRAVERDARVLDVHSDPVHNRSVLTTSGSSSELESAMTSLAGAASSIDILQHGGVHPRLGGLDVCPFVPHEGPMADAVRAAREAADRIAGTTGLPVYLYGYAARPGRPTELPELRKGGLAALVRRAASGFRPDAGPATIDPRRGVVCVGARDVLIAFNVLLACPVVSARSIATAVRSSGGGLPGVRALGLEIEPGATAQVSMNLLRPASTGIDKAFQAVADRARAAGIRILGAEIVGLVPERFLPRVGGPARRWLPAELISLEAALR